MADANSTSWPALTNTTDNMTWDYPYHNELSPAAHPAAHIINRYIVPIVCCFGILGIILTVIVLTRKSMCTSTNCYLISLASADLLFLVLLSIKCIEHHLTGQAAYNYTTYYAHIAGIFMQIFLMASIWLTVMLAVERYIAICRPFLAGKLCTVKKARIIIVMIFIISFIVRIPSFCAVQFVTAFDSITNTTVTFQMRASFSYGTGYKVVYPWMVNGVIMSIVPFCLLLVLNGCLIREVRKSTRYLQRNMISNQSGNTTGAAQKEEFQITVMLMSIIIVFFICQAPYVVYMAMLSLGIRVITSGLELFIEIAVFLIALKSSINFIVYCWFSEKFWATLKRVFCKEQYCATLNPHKTSQNGSYYNLRRQSHCTRDTLI